MNADSEHLARTIREAIRDKKGTDAIVLDVRRISSVTDFFVIASGGSPPHLRALAEEVRARAKAGGPGKGRLEGEPDSGWVVIDLGDAVVHLFLPDTRAYYGIEELWSDAPRLP